MNASSGLKGHRLSPALLLLTLALLLAGCDVVPRPMPTALPILQPTAQPGLPNPASVYCQEQGGRLEIRTDADGSQAGYCVFPDGSECEEWAFLRGECAPGGVPIVPPGLTPPPRRFLRPCSQRCRRARSKGFQCCR